MLSRYGITDADWHLLQKAEDPLSVDGIRSTPPKVEPLIGQAAKVEARSGGAPVDAMIVIPVRQTVLFPEIVFPITIGRALRELKDRGMVERVAGSGTFVPAGRRANDVCYGRSISATNIACCAPPSRLCSVCARSKQPHATSA